MQKNMSDAMFQEQKRRKKRKIISTIMAWILVLFIIVAIAFIVMSLVMAAGGKSLRGERTNSRPNLVLEESEQDTGDAQESYESSSPNKEVTDESMETVVVWQEGWVRHNGKIYEYNDDIMTFLVLGIDDMDVVTESTTATGGGQSDAIFLVIANPDKKEINILAVNRDTMTDIQMYGMGPDGTTVTAYGQLATQHGFGDGKELSCELTRDTVSALFYDLPIHGYVSINMGAIAKLNDAIGGVEITALEDVPKAGLKKDEKCTLKGMDAFWYVKWRDTKVFESNRGRLARQKQYLSAFTTKVKDAVKKDITIPVTLYQELNKYIVTDINVDEVTYLVGELLDYKLDSEAIRTLEGVTEMGEKHEEFYPDKDAMKELMITLFYEEVEID